MKFTFPILAALSLLGFAQTAANAANPVGDGTHLRSFLDAHCVRCHGEKKQKGDVALHNLSTKPKGAAELDLWKRIYEQVEGYQMPPIDSKQPMIAERQQTIELVKAVLKASGAGVDELKALKPARGNWVDHDTLFSGKSFGEAATPGRVWRVSPESYKQFFTRLGQQFGIDTSRIDIKSPWSFARQWDFADYSSSHRLSDAEIDHHLRNCASMAKILAPRFGNSNGPIKKMAAVLGAGKSATPEQVDAAVAESFDFLLHLPLDEAALKKYRDQLTRDLQSYDATMAAERFLIAVLCHREVLYRVEQPQGDGRRSLLAPRHIARAIAFTLTDREPDAVLWQAVAEGKLTSAEDVRKQVERILAGNDVRSFASAEGQETRKQIERILNLEPAVPKPRLLGFFQEYFGYTSSEDVFKDDSTMSEMYVPAVQGSFFYGGYLAADTDKLVASVLAADQQVLRTLLTTRKSFICSPELDGYFRTVAIKAAEKKRDAERAAKEGKPFDENASKYVVNPGAGWGWAQASIIYGVMPKAEWKEHLQAQDHHRVAPEPKGPELTVSEWGKGLPFDANPDQRLGILTQPSWLVAQSGNFDNHAIHRGRWIREKLLGGRIPDVPITVNAMLPTEPHHGLRERMRVTRDDYCWKCHKQMDPLGLPFEQFDHFGRYREQEIVVDKEKDDAIRAKNPTRKVRAMKLVPFDTTGAIEDSGDPELDGPVKGPLELIEKLSKSQRVEQVFVRHVFRYFLGRNETLADGPTLVAAHKAYRDSGGSFKALLVSLLSSESFLYRTVPVLAKNSP
jgi:mono/diheme cytochrome c family protein